MFLKTALALLLVCGGLIAAGCGGDDDETTTTSSTTEETGASGASGASGEAGAAAGGGLLPDDFAEQANQVCVAGNKELDAAAAALSGGGEPSQAELDEYVDEVFVPSVQGQIDAITALGEPEEGADELATALEDAQDALSEVEADPSILTSGDPFADVEAQFKELGLPACAAD